MDEHRITTPEQAKDAAWELANAMSNVVIPTLYKRDQLIRDMLRDHKNDSWLGDDYYAGEARKMGVSL